MKDKYESPSKQSWILLGLLIVGAIAVMYVAFNVFRSFNLF